MTKLIYYSLAAAGGGALDRQWIQSVRSLRRYNKEIPVWLIVFDDVSAQIQRECVACDVRIKRRGDYREFMRNNSPVGDILALYPTFHKFLAMWELDTSGVSQVLYLDCDTFFFGEVGALFDQYQECDWYTREAPTSRRCPYGYKPSNVNEEVLDEIAEQEGLRPVSPFNAGVCLMNHGFWNSFGPLRHTFLDYAWRLLVGRHQRVADGTDDEIRSAVLAGTTERDRARALPYPSKNFWIVDEFALPLTFGHLPRFSQGFISWDHIAQDREFALAVTGERQPILAHYFTVEETNFFSQVAELPWLHQADS